MLHTNAWIHKALSRMTWVSSGHDKSVLWHKHKTVNKLGQDELIHMKIDLSLKTNFHFLIIFCHDAAGELASPIMGQFLRSSNK